MLTRYIKNTLYYVKKYGFLETIKATPAFLKKHYGIDFLPKAYDSKFQEEIIVKDLKPSVKSIAFYLPQFHCIPENDMWWGEGFTEWTNTYKAEPRFDGHYQPRIPHDDIGRYDLSDVNTIKKQIDIAKRHGIYGFCLYYYWFSGKKLLEKPLDLIFENKDIDFNYCVCWANENWTRTWSGADENVLIKQEYKEQDPDLFMEDISKYLLDERYIKVDGKPIILVYNPREIKDVCGVLKRWREYAKKLGLEDIYILACRTSDMVDDNQEFAEIIDGRVDFPPRNLSFDRRITIKSMMNRKDGASVYDYRKLVKESCKTYENNEFNKSRYYTCMLGWDNSPRKEKEWHAFYGFSLKWFAKWLRRIIKNTIKNHPEDKRFVFINAWNEWGEGTYLEPDEKYGYASINTLTKASNKAR